MNPVAVRLATPADQPALRALHERSLRGLARGHMTPEAIGAFLASVDTLDDDLLVDGTCFVAVMGLRVVACGGWSLKAPSYARAIGAIEICGDPVPTVRAMYVDPVCAGRGLGRRILEHVEAAISAAGWRRAVLTASPMGVGFYERCGWRRLATVTMSLAGGLEIPSHQMDKLVLPRPGALPRASYPAVRAGAIRAA